MSWQEHGIASYQEYLYSDWWRELKEELLYRKGARCFVCKSRVTLLLHHVNYTNLYKEKLWQDIFIVCDPCHTKCHFWTMFHFKVPIKPKWLLFSIRLRKVIFYTQNRQFGLAAIWFSSVIIILIFNILVFTAGGLIKKVWGLVFKLFQMIL